MATDPGYQASEHIAELAGIVAKELGVEAQERTAPTEAVKNQYRVYYDDTAKKITMLYGDSKFALKSDEEAQNNLYPNIKGEITLNTTQVTYTKQPNNTTGGNTPVDRTGINVGDYIDYSPDSTAQTTYSKDKLTEAITGSRRNSTDITRDTLKLQVLKINSDGSMDIIGTPTEQEIYFYGALGCNNGVYVMNDICKTLYSRSGIEARSVNVEDFEYWLEQAGNTSIRDNYKDVGVQYNTTRTYKSNKKYPYLYQYEKGAGINLDTTGSGTLGRSETYTNEKEYTNGVTTNTIGEATGGNLTVTQTFWYAQITEVNFGEGAKVLKVSKKNRSYWLASRMARCGNSSRACFGLNNANASILNEIILVDEDDTYMGDSYNHLRPVVTLKSSTKIETSETASSSTGTAHHITQY